MVERASGSRLQLEATQSVRVSREGLRKHLERHVPGEARVAGAEHLAHAARAEQSEDLIGADARAGSQWHLKARVVGAGL